MSCKFSVIYTGPCPATADTKAEHLPEHTGNKKAEHLPQSMQARNIAHPAQICFFYAFIDHAVPSTQSAILFGNLVFIIIQIF